MKKIALVLCFLLLLCFMIASCSDSADDTTVLDTTTEALSAANTTAESLANTSTAGETTTIETAPVTTAPITTVAVTSEKTPEELLAENVYAQAGLELVLTVCEQYYDLRTNVLATTLTNKGATTVWPLASYIEMLAEAYRMFPDNETVKKYYTAALDRCLRKHMVTGATITPPSGVVYTNQTYYNAGPNWQGDFYYDDNAWICIQLLDAYKLLGKETYLDYAERILEFMWTGWDERAGGGIYWDKTFSGKGVCCNGPVAVAYCVGYQLTGKEDYLERAKMIYDWCGRLLRGKDGIYNAGIKNFNITSYVESNLDPWRPAYDQGTMLCTASLLYEITKDERYKTELSQTANASVNLLFNGNVMKKNPIFKSWCVGWLVRGEMISFEAGEERACKNFMRRMEATLQKTLKTKDANGHYDPFFCAPGDDFWSEDYFDDDVIMPTGVATVLLLFARYQVFQSN